MSIETEVKKLTAAINRIADYVEEQGTASADPGAAAAQPVQAAEQQPVQPQFEQQQPIPQQQPVIPTQPVQQQVPVQPAAPQGPALDDNSINQFLVAESTRLGTTGQQRIVALLQQAGASRVSDLPEASRPALIAAVQALI